MKKIIFAIISIAQFLLSPAVFADMAKGQQYLNDKNYTAAFNEFMKNAKGGNMYAQYIIAQLYVSGDGVDKDLREAATWYGMAADRGLIPAQKNLAMMYFTGRGVLQNFTEAARWFRRAADAGDMRAMASLAELYQKGEGVDQNYKTAYDYYLKSAKGGVKKSMNNLGYMHFNGQGVEANQQMAYMWFSIADLAGDYRGQLNKFDMRNNLPESQKRNAEVAAEQWLTQNPMVLTVSEQN